MITDPFSFLKFTPKLIRNFSIIAHIDHGKSTLADRLLEITNTISTRIKNEQVLDRLRVERERGITVKAQTASMFYQQGEDSYLLNLIDTPGHVDFSYEVSRSLKACEGAILLVDACQGVEAQTLANFYLAMDQDLSIIPVINKIDMQNAQPEKVKNELVSAFDVTKNEILEISAKTGFGIEKLLQAIIERIPPPKCNPEKSPRALLFDSWFDEYRGVICLLNIRDGSLGKGDEIRLLQSDRRYELLEIGIMHPGPVPINRLYAGQVGYMIAGMKTVQEARVGDTVSLASKPVPPFPGFKAAKPMVFAGIYPISATGFDALRDAIEKLTLNDPSVQVEKKSSPALGLGFRCGFLGLLHMDVFKERLEQEHNIESIVTPPSVMYRVKKKNGQIEEIENPSEFPPLNEIEEILEPILDATIITNTEYLGNIIKLCEESRGIQKGMDYLDPTRVVLRYELPLNEVALEFYDKLKSASSGYASLDYEELGYRPSDLVKMNILLNGHPVDALSTILHKDKAYYTGREITHRLRKAIPRQLFEVIIQAAIGSKIIAKERIPPLRKQVTAKCYGGDITRKRKLLEKQKEGKKRMKRIGNVEIPKEAFLSILKSDD